MNRYIKRDIEKTIRKYLRFFPAVILTGPRQSGKTTTLKAILGKSYKYISFDDFEVRGAFYSSPVDFLSSLGDRVIFDEAQYVPEIFEHLKVFIDADRAKYGRYVLTGSSRFPLMRGISESLAGRIGVLNLLPMTNNEVPKKYLNKHIVGGGWPELVLRDYVGAKQWFSSYLSTYIDKDLNLLFSINHLREFRMFLSLLATVASTELNMSLLASKIGVTVKTINSWLSVLEASYIVFTVPGYFSNRIKRIVKRPKLYFYDTGLLCYLLTGRNDNSIKERKDIWGRIFENYVAAEIKKMAIHNDKDIDMFYYRDNKGVEVDIVLENKEKGTLNLIEVKSASVYKKDFSKGIFKLQPAIKRITNDYKIVPIIITSGNSKDLGYLKVVNILKIQDEIFN